MRINANAQSDPMTSPEPPEPSPDEASASNTTATKEQCSQRIYTAGAVSQPSVLGKRRVRTTSSTEDLPAGCTSELEVIAETGWGGLGTDKYAWKVGIVIVGEKEGG